MKNLTQLQENFCVEIAINRLNQSDAYKAAGYSYEKMQTDTVYQAASRLAANSKVIARITSLRQTITDANLLTRSQAVSESMANLELARRANQLGPANGALKLAAELSGLNGPAPQGDTKITQVTIVMPVDTPKNTIEANGYKVLPPNDEATHLGA